jgi:hypothetical protein
MIVSHLIDLITNNWHKIVTVAAFFFAVYNKIMHDRLLTSLAQKAATIATPTPAATLPTSLPPPEVKSKGKGKKHKKNKH